MHAALIVLVAVVFGLAGFFGESAVVNRAPPVPAVEWIGPRATATPDPATRAVWSAVDDFLDEVPADTYQIAPDALMGLMQSGAVVVLDVREPAELNTGMIPGALQVPLTALTRSLDQLPPDKDAPIVVYCQNGQRGGLAMGALRTLGYTSVHNVQGGFNAWAQSGMPVLRYTWRVIP